MGPSGSGKSTLLNCLAGLDRPDTGLVRVAGEVITRLEGEALARLRRRHVSTIFQFFHLLPTLTAFETIELPLQLLRIDKAERHARVYRLLQAVQLEHRMHAMPGELSGGEMQRVAIARALIHHPDLVLADEPTGNLDSRTGDQVLDLLQSLADEFQMALVLVTHSREATRICQRTLHMMDGRLAEAAATT
jgi:ABC-type lipoprotein export system ATPase subunit